MIMAEKLSGQEFLEPNMDTAGEAVQVVMAAVDAYRANPTPANALIAKSLDDEAHEKFEDTDETFSSAWAEFGDKNGYDSLDVYEDTLSQIRSEDLIDLD